MASEIDTAGYHLFRSTGGRNEAVRLNPTRIPAGGEGTYLDSLHRYIYLDDMALDGVVYTYWLREESLVGGTSEYGPIRAAIDASSLEFQLYLPAALK